MKKITEEQRKHNKEERDRKWRLNHSEHNAKYLKDWRAKNPNYAKEHEDGYKEKRRESRWRCQGIDMTEWSYERYTKMLENQHGLCLGCDICIVGDTKGHRVKAHVDHDHNTGKVRGLLCSKCNQAIGLLGNNIVTLQRLIEYLTRNGDV